LLGLISSLFLGSSVASAQTYSLDTGCTMDTSIEKGGGSLGSRVKDCTNGGVIATNDDGTNFPFFEKETSATISRVSPDKVVISARARSASTFTSLPVPRITVNSHAQITVRVHAFPVNQSYLVQVDGTVLAEWSREGGSGLGSAGAGISIVNCPVTSR